MKKLMKKLKPALYILAMFAFGVIFGIVIAKYGAGNVEEIKEMSGREFAVTYALRVGGMLLCMYIAGVLQIILHEGGHLIAGVMTGYRFLSFRVGSLMLMKTGEGLKIKRLKLAGTGGQCLLLPPEMKDGSFPYVWYNLGGALINLVTAAIFFGLYQLNFGWQWVNTFCLSMVLIGVLFAIINGVPIHNNLITNDGYNALMLGKSADARRAMWIQLAVNGKQSEGVRLREMPGEWFVLPEGADMKNVMISTIGVFRENRLMDAGDFEAAKEQIRFLMSDKCNVVGLYKNMLLLDKLYIEILEKGSEADVSLLEGRQMKAFIKSMKNFPTIIRTEYAAAKASKKDEDTIGKILARFEKCAKSYPTPADIESERELMERVKEL